jgi:DNA-binding response OmpR family regulator
VLVLTADATFRAKQQALAGGANDFLTKPFRPRALSARLRALLKLKA